MAFVSRQWHCLYNRCKVMTPSSGIMQFHFLGTICYFCAAMIRTSEIMYWRFKFFVPQDVHDGNDKL
jgi:hypothetical protein